MTKSERSLDLKISCRKDEDCTENYYCQLSGKQNHPNQFKSEAKGFKILSNKFKARGFEFVTNGTCVLRGNLEVDIDAA